MNKTQLARPRDASQMPMDVVLENEEPALHCQEAVRIVPGRRLVCRGRWCGKAVYAKLFVDPRRARYDWTNELRGAHALASAELPGPLLLHSAALRGGGYVAIYEPIDGAVHLQAVWQDAPPDRRRQLMETLLSLIARQHGAGILQDDLHLNNFLVSESGIHVMDAGSLRTGLGPVARPEALQNLGLLFAQLPPEHDSGLAGYLETYAQARGWEPRKSDTEHLITETTDARAYRRKKFLQKIYRECTAFVCRRSFRRVLVYDRETDGVAMRGFLVQPDPLLALPADALLKQGNTCTIARTEIDGRALVIKRYNLKNTRHALKRAFRPTRASVSWRNAHLMSFLGIPTARPVALIEERFGPLRRRSWFVMEYVNGPHCLDYLRLPGVSQIEKDAVVERIVNLLEKLAASRISHGDMKATNIVIRDGQPVLLDLDAMYQHGSGESFRRAFEKDIKRLLRNWEDDPDMKDAFMERIKASALAHGARP